MHKYSDQIFAQQLDNNIHIHELSIQVAKVCVCLPVWLFADCLIVDPFYNSMNKGILYLNVIKDVDVIYIKSISIVSNRSRHHVKS